MFEFGTAKEFAQHINALGGTAYLVGGAVRDWLLKTKSVSDYDYVITGLAVDAISFEKVVGASFPVFIVKIAGINCEIALARTEKKKGAGYKGFELFTSPLITIEEDLRRRDLTINATAINILTGELIDPFGGCSDLDLKVLRHVSSAFSDDPLRVLRVARFSAELGFDVMSSTLSLMRQLKNELNLLPAERIWKETEKALKSKHPNYFFNSLINSDTLKIVFPEIAALDVPDKHDGTALEHTINLLGSGRNDALINFGLLMHDLGKGLTPKDSYPCHYEHDKSGLTAVSAFCERLKVPNKYRDFGLLCCKEHMRIKNILQMKSGKQVKYILSLGDVCRNLITVSFIDSVFRDGANVAEETVEFAKIKEVVSRVHQASNVVTGKTIIDSGYKECKNFGSVLLQKRIEYYKENY